MTDVAHSADLDVHRRRILFRSWHRGMRELDLILGRFAERTINELTAEELLTFEQLMEVPDCEILAWVMGEADVPLAFDTALFRRLRAFNWSGEGSR